MCHIALESDIKTPQMQLRCCCCCSRLLAFFSRAFSWEILHQNILNFFHLFFNHFFDVVVVVSNAAAAVAALLMV
jgi:hypothetical protein